MRSAGRWSLACNGLSSGSVLISGGNCNSNSEYGPFMCNGNYSASESDPNVGARLLNQGHPSQMHRFFHTSW